MYSLIQDFIANGVCDGLDQAPFFLENPFMPPTTSPCLFTSLPDGTLTGIDEGTCSAETETLLQSKEDCGYVLRQQTNLIFQTLQILFQLM